MADKMLHGVQLRGIPFLGIAVFLVLFDVGCADLCRITVQRLFLELFLVGIVFSQALRPPVQRLRGVKIPGFADTMRLNQQLCPLVAVEIVSFIPGQMKTRQVQERPQVMVTAHIKYPVRSCLQ